MLNKELAEKVALEDALPEEALSEEQRKRKKQREAKRSERQRKGTAKREKAVDAELAKVSSRDEFWKVQQARLTSAQLAAMLVREKQVLALSATLRAYMNGTLEVLDAEDAQWLAETTDEFQSELETNGFVTTEVLLVKFWKHTPFEKSFFNQVVENGGPTADFIRFGIYTALSSALTYEFEQWLEGRKPRKPSPSKIETQRCSQCGGVASSGTECLLCTAIFSRQDLTRRPERTDIYNDQGRFRE